MTIYRFKTGCLGGLRTIRRMRRKSTRWRRSGSQKVLCRSESTIKNLRPSKKDTLSKVKKSFSKWGDDLCVMASTPTLGQTDCGVA